MAEMTVLLGCDVRENLIDDWLSEDEKRTGDWLLLTTTVLLVPVIKLQYI